MIRRGRDRLSDLFRCRWQLLEGSLEDFLGLGQHLRRGREDLLQPAQRLAGGHGEGAVGLIGRDLGE